MKNKLSNTTVLVIEDNEDVKNIIVVYLKSHGCVVHEASDGQTGLDMALRLQPDVILLDVLLPKLDGIETLQALRSASAGKNLPVVMMSAVLQTRDIRSETASLNVSSFLHKPFQIKQLLECIQNAMKRSTGATVKGPGTPGPETRDSDDARNIAVNAGSVTHDVENSTQILCKSEALPLKGDLTRFPLPKLLHSIFIERRTGRLRILCNAVEKRIYFQNGYPVYSESSLPSETLGAFLVATQRISEEQHREIQMEMEKGAKQYGEVVLRLKYIGPHELFIALEENLSRKIVSAFSWFEGQFLFQAGDSWKDQIVVARMKPGRIILDGIYQHWTDEQIRQIRIMRDTNIPFVLEQQPYADKDLSLTTQEARVWGLVKQNLSLSQILARVSDESIGLKSLFFFYLTTMIGFRVSLEGQPLHVKSTVVPAPKQTVSRSRTEGNERAQRLMGDYIKYRTVDYFTLLGVTREASPTEINHAYLEKKKQFHPDKLIGISNRLVHEKMEELNMLLHKAYIALMNDKEKQKYISALDNKQDATMLAPRSRTNKHTMLTFSASKKSHPEQLYEKGFSLLRDGEYGDAHDAFATAEKEEPKAKYKAYTIWTAFLLQRSSFEDAEKDLKVLFRKNKDEALIPYLLGCLFLKEKKSKEAIVFFERVLSIDSQHIDAARQLRIMRMRSNSEVSGLFEMLKRKK